MFLPRCRAGFLLAAFLLLGVRLPAQQPWPGAGSDSGAGSGTGAGSGSGSGAGSGRSGTRSAPSGLRPLLPIPPPPPPPPPNPVFPQESESQGGGNSSGALTESQGAGAAFLPGENQQAVVTESLLLAAAEVYPGGDRSRSAADTISHIFYTAYSDQSRSFTVVFKNGPSYVYYLRNPRGTVRMGGALRVTYDTVIQAGTQMVNGFFFSELNYLNGRPDSLAVINSSSGAAVVVIRLREAQM